MQAPQPLKEASGFCSHVQNLHAIIDSAVKSHTLHKEQCTDCYIDHTSPNGIDLCLTCFKGSCVTSDLAAEQSPVCGTQGHCASHAQSSGHTLALNIRKKIELTKREKNEITKIAINKAGGGGDDFIEVPVMEYHLNCYQCKTSTLISDPVGPVRTLIQTIEDRSSSGMQNKIKAWELEILPCDHSRNLPLTRAVYTNLPKLDIDLSNMKCYGCDLKTNLWLCLVCGTVGCGRQHFDGSGGNGHAKAHYEQTKHPLMIKIGTIGGNENVSSYCYLCDNDVRVPNLMKHLTDVFGDQVHMLRKTEKTINEMSLEINLNFELSKAFEEKEKLVPLDQLPDRNFFWGIANIGNSCYINSVVQALTGYPEVIAHFLESTQSGQPSTLVQEVRKLFEGIRRRSQATSSQMEIPSSGRTTYKAYHYMPRPYKFREVVADGHSEFKTTRQQDAAEYFTHLLNRLSSGGLAAPPTKDFFRIPIANKLVCSTCSSFYVRESESFMLRIEIPHFQVQKILSGEKTVNLKQLLGKQGILNGDEVVKCQRCNCKKVFDSRLFLRGFPQNVVVCVKPFYVQGLSAKKMDLELQFEENDTVPLGDLRFRQEEVRPRVGR